MTKWHSAVHAARSLIPEFLLRHMRVELLPVMNSLRWLAGNRERPRILHEACHLTHRIEPQRNSKFEIRNSKLRISDLTAISSVSDFAFRISNFAFLYFPPTRAWSCEFNSK